MSDLRDCVAASRNVLREHALKNGYDYFLSLEQDVIPPVDVIEKLMSRHQPVVSGVYYKQFHVTYTHQGKPVKTSTRIFPLICTLLPGTEGTDKAHLCSPQEVEGNQFFRIRGAGLGCLLIHCSILEKIKFRIAKDKELDKGSFDDINFSNDLWEMKIPMYTDTSVKCRHMVTRKDKMLFYQ